MRDIKFRAWIKVSKQWVSMRQESVDSLFELCAGDDGAVTVILKPLPEYVSVDQYTGLEDKNGVEVYEGDIIKEPDYGNIYQIVFDSGAFGTINPNESLSFEPLCDSGVKNDIVIGNIHENPELLKPIPKMCPRGD